MVEDGVFVIGGGMDEGGVGVLGGGIRVGTSDVHVVWVWLDVA